MGNYRKNDDFWFYELLFKLSIMISLLIIIKLPGILKRIIFSPMYIGQHFRDKKMYKKSDYKDVIPYKKYELKQDKGKWGEYLLFKNIQRILPESRILPNVYIPGFNEKTTEIDLIAVDKTGIYVFESKNYKGKLKGFSQDTYWQSIVGKEKNEVYNPLLQNKRHIEHLSNYLGISKDKMHNLVMFHNVKLNVKGIYNKKLNFGTTILKSSDINLKVLSNKYKIIDKFKKKNIELTKEEINKIADKLKTTAGINTEIEIKEKHISNIQNFNTTTEIKEEHILNQIKMKENELEILRLKQLLKEPEIVKQSKKKQIVENISR